MNLGLDGKTAAVTGASSGIGKACALAAAEYGFYVYAGCRKESDKINLEKLHPNIHPVILDIENETDKKNILKITAVNYETQAYRYMSTEEFSAFAQAKVGRFLDISSNYHHISIT